MNQTKKPTYSWFCDECRNCVNKNKCVYCHMMNYQPRKYQLKILGYREPQNKYMKHGINIHKQFFQDIKTLEQYGIKNFFKDLYQGKTIKIKEFKVCSKTYALKGHIDCVEISYKNNIYNINIIELKPSFRREYFYQLGAYALILSDPNCSIVYKKKVKKEHWIARNLYPNKNFIINITSKFIYYKFGKENISEWVNNNVFKKEVIFAVQRKANKLREMHGAREISFSRIPYCSGCSMVDENAWKCYYEKICKKYPYNGKEKQMRIGKKKIIVK